MTAWSASRQAGGGWLFTWSGGVSPWRIYFDGVLLDTVTAASYACTIDGYADSPPPLEISGSAETPESLENPPFAVLQWRGLSTALSYLVQEYSGGAWITRRTIFENGSGYYSYQTRALPDCTDAQWRVIAVNSYGHEGAAIGFVFSIIRNPAPVKVDISCSGGNIVVGEA